MSNTVSALAVEPYDVAIVGAGPGGAMCALGLKNSGLRVAVLDKAKFPRDKICGDALSGKVSEALKLLAPELADEYERFSQKLSTTAVRIVSPSGDCLEIAFKQNQYAGSALGHISTRLVFDNFLVDKLRGAANISLLENCSVKNIAPQKDFIDLHCSGRTIRASVVVGADGAQSLVAKRLANFTVDPKHYSAAVRAYVSGLRDERPENYVEFYILKDILPGYLWIFPLPNGMANVGMGVLSSALHKKRLNLREKLVEILSTHPLIAPRFKNATITDSVKGFGLPLGSKRFNISGERFMLVGDAASLIDPLTGEGIGEAMLSGGFAAKEILHCFEAQDFSAAAMKRYDDAVYGRLWNSFQLHAFLQKVAATPFIMNFLVRKVSRSPMMKDFLANMVEDFEARKQLANPSFYLKLLFE
jgi:menaquinone-9 beta-reductase